MKIEALRVTCKCRHVFDAEVVVNAPISVAAASMKAVRCPKCGSNKLGLGGDITEGKPAISAPLIERSEWWRHKGEIGTSSLTIWCAFTEGRNPHGGFCYPLDPDDFRRCKQLLDLIPEWRLDIQKVADRFKWFQPFVDSWSDFEQLYIEEASGNSAPRLYAAMQVARKEADRLKR